MKTAALLAALAFAAPAFAQDVEDCDWRANVQNIPEPWGEHTASYANGKTRLVVLDTVEPALVPFHLMILSPPYNEYGERQCRVIGMNGAGFAGIYLDEIEAEYDPETGLGFILPIGVPDDAGDVYTYSLHITLNQATGDLMASLSH